MTKQYGHTQFGFFPSYINVTARDDGKMRITVRSASVDGGNTCGSVAHIDLDRSEYDKLREAMADVAV